MALPYSILKDPLKALATLRSTVNEILENGVGSSNTFKSSDFVVQEQDVSLNPQSPLLGADLFVDDEIFAGQGSEEVPLTIDNLPITLGGTQSGDQVTLFISYKDQVLSTFSFTATSGGGSGTPQDDLQLGNIMLQSTVTSNASSFFPGEGPELAHDYTGSNPNLGTNWTSNASPSEGAPQFIQFDMGSGHSRKPNKFRMMTVKPGDPASIYGRAAKRFQVWASNEALFSQGTYTVVLNETNNTTAPNVHYEKAMNTPARFRYFRVVFLELADPSAPASAADIQMLQE